MNSNQQRIQELAHQIWESEGKPHGQSVRHWDTACKLIIAENEIDETTMAETLTEINAPSQADVKTNVKPDIKTKKRTTIAEEDETLLAVVPKTEKKSNSKKEKSTTNKSK